MELFRCEWQDSEGNRYTLPECVVEEKINYKQGNRHGPYESYFIDGQLSFKRNYKDGRLDGLHEQYGENGQLKWHHNRKNGKKHGLSEIYFAAINAVSKREFYVDDLLHGLSLSYDNAGALTRKKGFKEGQQHGLEVAYADNETWFTGEDGELYSNENIRFASCYFDGVQDKWKTRDAQQATTK